MLTAGVTAKIQVQGEHKVRPYQAWGLETAGFPFFLKCGIRKDIVCGFLVDSELVFPLVFLAVCAG